MGHSRTCTKCGAPESDETLWGGESRSCPCGADDWRQGGWIQTYSGKMFWPFDPRTEDVEIVDIAVPLSRMCRFGGHIQHFYSVAEHSLWVAGKMPKMLGPRAQLAALLHDASEAYLLDIPRPIKQGVQMGPYRQAERTLLGVIFARFGVSVAYLEHKDRIKEIDNRALATEKRDLVAQGPGRWSGIEGVEPHSYPISRHSSMSDCVEDFMKCFEILHNEFSGASAAV